ncbi:MAG: MFS transporter, partial [Anaerolineales bacterium]
MTEIPGEPPPAIVDIGRRRPLPSPLLWPSAFYLLVFAAYAAVFPFLALYYQSLGLSGGQVGLLLGVPPLVGLIASPLWTGLADATRRHRAVLVITILASTAGWAALPWIRAFAAIFAVTLAIALLGAPVMALADTATLSMLGGERDQYGRIRVWGTVGWGLAAPLVGEVLERNGLPWMFGIYAGLMVLSLLTVGRLRFSLSASATPLGRGLLMVLTDRRWLVFMVAVLVTSVSLAGQSNFLSILLEEMGTTTTFVGIALTISTLSELPVMFFSPWLLRRFKPEGLLLVAMASSGLRALLYFVAGSPDVVLAIQVLHGLTFPALWIAGVTYASENAPPGLGATAQAFFGSVLMGLG